MARIRCVVAVVMLLFAAGMAAAQSDWDAAHDWAANANPSGSWSYGSKAGSASAAFVPFSAYMNPAAAFPQRDSWSGAGTAAVYHNSYGFGGDMPTSMLVLDPDTAGNLAVVRWTAPAAGAYVASGQFDALGSSTAQVTIVSNGAASVLSQALTGGSSAVPFTVYVNAAAGDTLDFVAAAAGASDETGLKVAVHALHLNRSTPNGGQAGVINPFSNLQITDRTGFEGATAWTMGKQQIADGFDTTFRYNLGSWSNPPADGFAFTIQDDPAGSAYLNGMGGTFGVMNITHALVIEFDTYVNDATDGPGPHLAVTTGGNGPWSYTPECSPAPCTASAGGYTITTLGKFNYANFNPAMSGSHLVRVKYTASGTPTLFVYLDAAAGGHGITDTDAPVLTMPVNLQTLLGFSGSDAYVGFGGGTGGFTELLQIYDWHFTSLDITPPVISSVADITMEANTSGGANVGYSVPTATDSRDGALRVGCSPASGSLFPVGKTAVTCTATDFSGNAAQSSFNVTITDTTPPSLVLPANVTAEATSASGAAISYVATASDIVDGALVPACLPASGSMFPVGTTAVSCSATDAHGNTASGSFNVSVSDTTPPVLSLPANITASATSAKGATVNFTATASDLVDGAVPVSCSPASGSLFPIATTTVNCSATDAHGNSASGSFQVTVVAGYSVRLLYNPNFAKQSGSGYPIRLQILDGSGRNVSSASLMLQATGVESLTGGAPGPLESEGRSNPGLVFRYDPDFNGYAFNLKLDGYQGGAFDLMFSVGGVSNQAAPFSVEDNRGSHGLHSDRGRAKGHDEHREGRGHSH